MRRMVQWGSWSSALALALAGCNDSNVATTGDGSSSSTGITTTTDPSADVTGATSSSGPDQPTTTGVDTTAGEESTTGEPPWEGMQAGVAVRYLDRPVGISMAGYGGRIGGTSTPWNGIFLGTRGFYALPTIKAMVLESSNGEMLVMLKTPLMSGESGVTDALAAKLLDRHGLDLQGRVILTATHSHHIHGRYWRLPDIFGAVGADTADEEVIDLLATELSDAVAEAVDNLGPAQWAWSYVEDWDPQDRVYRDRRHVNDFAYGKDPRLTLLAVRRPDGEPLAAILDFAMHGILLGSDNELLTEDAAGGLEMVFEEQFFAAHGQPIVGMFMQAGGGDASPAGGFLGHDDIARAEVIGHQAAPTVLEQWDALQWRDELALDVHSQRVDLTYEFFGYDESDEFQGAPFGLPLPLPYTWGGWQCTSPSAPEDDDPGTSMEGELKECIPIDVLLFGDVPNAEVHQTYLTVARLDELLLATVPGEPTFSVMKYLRDQVALRAAEGEAVEVMGIGYSQDHLLYFTHPDDWFQGGYESEMSLWGPFAGRTIIDTQLAVIDQMLGGQDMDPFVEQSPSLASPGGFTPRAYEVSLNAGEIIEDVTTDMMRTETVRLRFGAGDPSLGAPRVRVQVDPGDGTFVDVASPAGWPGGALDNSRYHMITHYDPNPAPNGNVAASRNHEWYVDWEIAADLPAGIYRLVASGPVWEGGAEGSFEATSTPFAVHQAVGAALPVSRAGSVLTIRMELPPVVAASEESWPIAGWRVHDPEVGPADPITVRVPLTLTFAVDGVPQPGEYPASYDATAGGHVFDLADAGLDGVAGVITVQAHLAADVDPDPIEGVVP
ncbi:neutral/alkaline non-lysosomal ceramidase N-terminal domain-containing protein [Paraliomyxa miuraensis]|uniref:neutral/alkaline non-lysosomal ceramidase N-terminal domain-containing protein n=1 Tax=Paraliomyxa miuraensis TaxID=376150 RepID=UPI00225647A2|nr:neutral/alkaline non-lysosomal ceramidase N-terminal domain-containing protein [Paraliomyxa miuraensis]MCX4241784.1 neutral/alkaline non-lysosomal ceramidase N-terminal domain-containing protein [Paraliomyxa miuraensis]